MASQEEGEAAIVALNGSEHMGRTINVAVAHDRPAAPVAPVEEPEAENENEPKD